MNITIKNLKHADFASEETYCFSATVYVDGKRAFLASNDGHGVCNSYDSIKPGAEESAKMWKQLAAVNDHLKTLMGKEFQGKFLQPDLDWILSDLVGAELTRRHVKKILRRISFVKDGALYQYSAKLKPTPANLAKVNARLDGDFIILNCLALPEAIELINQTAKTGE